MTNGTSNSREIFNADIFRQALPPLRNVDKAFTFFYDETNNIRRLTLSELGVNAPDWRTFVIGGIALHPGQAMPDVSDLRSAMRIDPGHPEMKFSMLAQGDFEAILKSAKLPIFLQWCLDNDILIHYSAFDVLYWSIIDIVDSINAEYLRQGIPAMSMLDRQLKTALYEVARADTKLFMEFLHSFAYPNVSSASIASFVGHLHQIASEVAREMGSLEVGYLSAVLKGATKLRRLSFIQDNAAGELISDFSSQFMHRIWLFNKATHTFDTETFIQSLIGNLQIQVEGKPIDYRFVDSKHEAGVQLSDILTGVIGKYFNFLQDNDYEAIEGRIKALSPAQRRTLDLLRELIDRSEAVSEGFLHQVIPLTTEEKRHLVVGD